MNWVPIHQDDPSIYYSSGLHLLESLQNIRKYNFLISRGYKLPNPKRIQDSLMITSFPIQVGTNHDINLIQLPSSLFHVNKMCTTQGDKLSQINPFCSKSSSCLCSLVCSIRLYEEHNQSVPRTALSSFWGCWNGYRSGVWAGRIW